MNGCIFCRLAEQPVEDALQVYGNEHVFALISRHQKAGNRGHALVMPRKHVPDIYSLPPEIDAPLMSALRLVSIAVREAFSADGVHIRQNNEAAAGQDVFHLHFHVIPRYRGDGFEERKYEETTLERRREQAEKLGAVIRRITAGAV